MSASNSRREVADLQVKVQRARWRLRAASLGGPEWDAATELLSDLEAQLEAVRRGGKPRSESRGQDVSPKSVSQSSTTARTRPPR